MFRIPQRATAIAHVNRIVSRIVPISFLRASQRLRHAALISLALGPATILLAQPPQPVEPTSEQASEFRELRERFGEQQFEPEGGFVLKKGQPLPGLVWERPELIANVVSSPEIKTRWFNDQFEEVTVAPRPGRYFVYGEAPSPDDRPLRRAMTCCCVDDPVNLTNVAETWLTITKDSSTPDKRRERVQKLVTEWKTSEAGAVELSAFLETSQQSGPDRPGQWQMENATRHVRLKRQLMGLDDQPPVRADARRLSGEPAPELRRGPIAEAKISQKRVQQIEAQLSEWFAASKTPMAVVIARHGVIVSARGYGKLQGQAVTIDTPMKLDSAMKPLIGIQLATFVDREILRLDEPLGRYLPDFDSTSDRNLTFRAGHVHATGIHFPWDLAFSRLFYFHTWHESLIAHCKREWLPGERYRYGVVGVILSVRALELLRGRNYWDAMERDIFAPLGIRHVWPGGTGFSAESLARIGVLLDNKGKYGPWEFFSEETHDAMLPTSLTPWFPKLDRVYGIGLQDQSRHLGPGSYGHGGGCGTYLLIHPHQHLVVAMVRNERGADYDEQFAKLTRLLHDWIHEAD